MITSKEVRNYALSLPESKEKEHWGKASFRINDKIFAVMQEDGITLTVKTSEEERIAYTSMDPETFKIPDSFSNLNYMHVNMTRVERKELQRILLKAWSTVAPKRLVKKYLEELIEEEDRGR